MASNVSASHMHRVPPSSVSVVDRKAVLVVYGDGFKATLKGADRIAGNPDKLVYMGNQARR